MNRSARFDVTRRLRSVGRAVLVGCALATLPVANGATLQRPAQTSLAVAQYAVASPFQLTGIVAVPAAHVWRAIVAGAAGDERTYRIGERLPDGWTLTEIRTDRIVVSRDGRTYVLGFLADLAIRAAASQETTALAASADERGDRATMPLIVRATPVLLLQWLAIEPQMSGDRLTGYRIGEIADPSLLSELGLEPGDVLTAINDLSLDGLHPDAWALSRSPTPSTLRLTFLRRGEYRSLAY